MKFNLLAGVAVEHVNGFPGLSERCMKMCLHFWFVLATRDLYDMESTFSICSKQPWRLIKLFKGEFSAE